MRIKNCLNSALAVLSTTLAFAMPAHSTLVGRDIDGHAVAGSAASAVFLYDTDLNITWLRDFDYIKTSGFRADGALAWAAANDWAANLVIGAFEDWRLPAGESCTRAGQVTSNCTTSEMGHLYYTELGNIAVGFQAAVPHTGDFQNLTAKPVWEGINLFSGEAAYFAWHTGATGSYPQGSPLYVTAVRDGDVLTQVDPPTGQVPEPGSLALLGAALAGIVAVRKRKQA